MDFIYRKSIKQFRSLRLPVTNSLDVRTMVRVVVVGGLFGVARPCLTDRVVAAAGAYPSAGKAGGSDDEAGLLATEEACARVWCLSPSMAAQKQLRAKPTNNFPLLLALSSRCCSLALVVFLSPGMHCRSRSL